MMNLRILIAITLVRGLQRLSRQQGGERVETRKLHFHVMLLISCMQLTMGTDSPLLAWGC